MAPRRGGGGGSFSSSRISCDSDAFSDEQSRVDIAFAALWFVVAVVLFFTATRRFGLNKKQGSPVVGSVFLGFSMFFALGAHLTNIIVTAMTQCGTGTSYNYVATIVYNWLSQVSAFILTALIMTTICRKLQSDFARVQPAILTLQTVWVAMLGALLVSVLSMITATYHYSFSGAEEHYEAYDLVNPIQGVQTTYYTLAVLGLLIASASMLKALFSAPAYLRKGAIGTWVPILALSALGYSAASLGTYIQSAFFFSSATMTSSKYLSYVHGQQAGRFLIWFFFFLAFYAALKIASYRSQSGAVHAAPHTSINPTVPTPHAQQSNTLNHGYDSHLNYNSNFYQQSQGQNQNQNQFGGYQPNQGYGGNHPMRY